MIYNFGRRRRSIRLRGYNYTQGGAYFVTICTKNKECLFGEVMDGEMRLNRFGRIVWEEWFNTMEVRPYVRLFSSEFVIMPNHLHGIIWIVDDGDKRRTVYTDVKEVNAKVLCAGSLGAIIRGFKSSVTRRINKIRNTPGGVVWQRNYYEHIIRDEEDLKRIREYIMSNPFIWTIKRKQGIVDDFTR